MRSHLKFLSVTLFALTFLVGGFFVANKVSAVPSAPGDVIINEFVQDPSSGSEWVELLNTTQSSIDITGWKIQDFTFSGETITGVHDNVIGALTIPANGIVTVDVTGLNNNADSIVLYDNSSTPVAINNVVYGTVATQTTTAGLGTAPGLGRSAAFYSGSWHADETPTKGWFNDAGQVGRAPLLSTIDSTITATGITTNIGELTNPSATPSTEGTSALYFEKAGYGKIVFEKVLNMTDQNTVGILQSLGSAMEMSAGHIKFDSTTATAMNATGAKIYMYGLTGFNTEPNLIVKNDSGTVIPPSDVTNYPTIVKSWNNTDKTLSFTTSHFTQFDIDNNVYVDVSNGGTEDGSSAHPYNTIAEGITAVPTGGTVHVSAGTYAENVVISKGLTLQGTTGAIIAPATGPGVQIEASPASAPVKVDSFTITPQSSTTDSAQGIVIGKNDNPTATATHGIIISNNTITTTGVNMGILVRGVGTNGSGYPNSSDLTVDHNTITLDGDSTAFYASWVTPAHSNWNINHNTFNSPVGVNLELYNVNGVTIDTNIFEPSGSGGSGSVFISAELDNSLSAATVFSNNDVRGNGTAGGSMVVFTNNLKTTGTGTMGDVTINGNSFNNWDSRALLIHKAGVTVSSINENKFLDTGQAIDNRNGVLINATNNWWGSALLADVVAKISSNGNLNFKPYYTTSTIGGSGILSSVKAITAFTIPSQTGSTTINESAHTIGVTMPYDTNVTALIPTFTTTGSVVKIGTNVQTSATTANDFTSPVTYTVTSVDEATTQDYVVTVTVALNPAKAITAFTIPSQVGDTTINESAHTIALTMPFGTDLTSLTPTITKTGASVSPASGVAHSFSSAATYTVTAADSTTQAYTVTVSLAANPDIASVASDKDALTNNSIKGDNTDLANVTGSLATLPASGSNGSTITWASNNTSVVSNNGQTVVRPAYGASNASVTLTATITKGVVSDTKAFSLTVLASLNTAKAITAFNFASPVATGVVNETTHTIAINVPNGTSVTALVPSITISGSSVSPNTGVAHDFTTPQTYIVTAANSSTQEYTVTVTVLPASQIAAAPEVEVNTTQKEVVVNSTAATTITIPENVPDATIDVSSLTSDDLTHTTATLPDITMNVTTSLSTTPVTVEIPTGTVVTAPTGWDGTINAPTIKENSTVTATADSGMTSTVSSVIEVGYGDVKLTFDNAVRIFVPGQAGKFVGYSRSGVFTEITNTCAADNQATGDALVAEGDCKIDVGSDLVIWTKHFTKFATYTQTATRGGSSGYIRPVIIALTPVVTPIPAIGQVLGAEKFNFTKFMKNGSKGDEIIELQKLLTSLGYDCGIADGKFGPKTKGAVIKFQKANKLVGDGIVGAKTRAELNK